MPVFTLEAFNADEGDCFLLAFGDESECQFIVIDGGPGRATYDGRLKPRLIELAKRHGRLELPLVACSHIDSDHIGGLVALLDDVAYDRAPVAMHCLWHKRPLDLVGEQDARRFAAIVRADRESERYATAESQYFADHNWEIDPAYVHVIASVEEGDKLYQMAENARIPINCGFDDLVMAPTPEAGAATYQVGDLRLTVLGPGQEQLEALRRKWKKETKDQSLETLFEQSQRIAAIVAADDDRSVTNLSSLVFLVEFAGRSILMTGDARGHYVRDALMRAKRLSRGKVHIDVLKLQHHGSIRNVDTAFFEAVTADEYVISANGEYHNPDEATLAALVEARGQTGFRVWLTNGDAGTKLAPMVAEWRARYPDLVIEVRPSGAASLRIELEAALPS